MIFRGLEMATVTRREVNYEKIISQIKAQGINPEAPGLAQYLDSFKYGMPDEGGFGFGIARFVQKLIGLSNIKEAELFPSDTKMISAYVSTLFCIPVVQSSLPNCSASRMSQ